jgi:Na+/H+ antiporter NhaD/arsenite permease-like protein
MGTQFTFYLAIVIFVLTYAAIMSEKIPRSICALLGAGAVIYTGLVTQEQALKEFIDFNTIGLLVGMMMLISVVKKSGLFEATALWAMKVSRGRPKELLILLSLITGVSAAFIDSVTAALLITPMTISICRRLKISPIPTLIGEILLSNVGGTALMVGNPPNVMIGSATHLTFNDFALNMAPVSILCSIVVLVYLELIYRKSLPKMELSQEQIDAIDVKSVIQDPVILKKSLTILLLTITGFILHHFIGMETATVAMSGGVLATIVCRLDPRDVLNEVDWDTLFFFMGLFICVGGLEVSGVISAIAQWGISLVQGDAHLMTYCILWLSAIASAFVDNIPFTATMIPLVQEMQSLMNLPHADYMWWALAVGACYGGNGTIIGASPNVIVAAMAAKEGYKMTFGHFMLKCFPIMLLTVAVSMGYIYVRYFLLGGA